MQQVIAYLADHPWIWIASLLSLSASIAMSVLVARSPKFLQKGAWILLCFCTYAYSTKVPPDMGLTISVAPIGALYVLLFWRFGPAPTPAQIARNTERLARQRARFPPTTRATAVRSLYVCATGAVLLMGALLISGALADTLIDFGAPMSDAKLMIGFALAGFIPALAAFAFVVFRPYWWGKLLCAWAGLSWIGFALVNATVLGFNAVLLTIFGAGAAMLLIAVAHHVLDPRFSGGYLRGA